MYVDKIMIYIIISIMMLCPAIAFESTHDYIEKDVTFVMGVKFLTVAEPNPICQVLNNCLTPFLENYKIQVYINTQQDKEDLYSGNLLNFQIDNDYTYRQWWYSSVGSKISNNIDWKNNNIRSQKDIGNSYGTPSWLIAYMYKNNKNNVCDKYAKIAMNSPEEVYINPEYADTIGCFSWDGGWKTDEYYNYKIPTWYFNGINHITPKNYNFGEPPIIIEECKITCRYGYETSLGSWVSDNTRLYDFVNTLDDLKYTLDTEKLYFSDTHRGVSVWQNEQHCGAYYPAEDYTSGLSCVLSINPNYRHNSVYDNTLIFSDLFTTGPLSQPVKSMEVDVLIQKTSGDDDIGLTIQPKSLKYPEIKNNEIPQNSTSQSNDNDDNNLGGGQGNFDTDGDGDDDNNTYIRTQVDGLGGGQLISQKTINLELQSIQKKNNFNRFLLKIVDMVTSLILILAYILQLTIIIWVFFIMIPGIFIRFMKLLQEVLIIKIK